MNLNLVVLGSWNDYRIFSPRAPGDSNDCLAVSNGQQVVEERKSGFE